MNFWKKCKLETALLIMLMICFYGNGMTAEAAASDKNSKTGKLQVTGGEYGTDYRYSNNTLTILTDKSLTISGNSNEDAIVVKNGVDANLNLKDLTVRVNDCALDIGDSNAVVKFSGDSSLRGGPRHPGIRVRESASLILKGGKNDSIQVYGGSQSAGIGSESEEPFGTVTVESGKLQVKGGARAAGIGSGYKGSGGTVSIKGGYLNVAGGTGGASLGCPQEGYGSSSVTVDGDALVVSGQNLDKIELKRGILASNGNIRVEGDVILNYPLTVSASQKMIIPGEGELVIPRNLECKNEGSIIVYGKLDVRGKLENKGEIVDYSGLLEKDPNISGNEVKVYDMRDIYMENGSVSISTEGYEQNDTAFEIAAEDKEAYHLYGGDKAADSSIEVEKGTEVSLTLEDVILAPKEADSVLRVNENAQVTLIVNGDNEFQCGNQTLSGGIVLEKNALLEIRGTGSLTVKSANGSRMVIYSGDGNTEDEEDTSDEEDASGEKDADTGEAENDDLKAEKEIKTISVTNSSRLRAEDVQPAGDEIKKNIFFQFQMKSSTRDSKTRELYFDREALAEMSDNNSGFSFMCNDLEIELDDRAVGELYDATLGDIVLRITPFVPGEQFTNAKAAIGSRPQFDIQIVEEHNGKESVVNVNFASGKARIAIPYSPSAQEEVRNLYVVYVGANNLVEWMKDSYFDRKSGKMISPVRHFSVYGVGYLTAQPQETQQQTKS